MIVDRNKAWRVLLNNAANALAHHEILTSPRRQHLYHILGVTTDGIRLQREEGDQSIEILTRRKFETAMNNLQMTEKPLPKTSLYPRVLIETTLVAFLPFLDWDEEARIVPAANYVAPSTEELVQVEEAAADNLNDRIEVNLRRRRGQNKLRENLFVVYGAACCLSGCQIRAMLHAAHLIPHAESGVNLTTNALLLRADLHDLFDSHLLGIHPSSLVVHLHPEIDDDYYQAFSGQSIKSRVDNKSPDYNALEKRWEKFLDRCRQPVCLK
jgi:hypothetical protein